MKEKGFGFCIGRIRRAYRREIEARASVMDLTAAQHQVLRRLWRGDRILASVLAKDILSDSATLTGLLDRLENKGLIRRERSSEDRRAIEIVLTPEGRALEEPGMKVIREINELALADFSEAERDKLLSDLESIAEKLEALRQ
ncbi:MAG: MarR family transcriptional regulator [Abitibacteriaceae bacterium]|nr:MarR family transcriptional regulator [Abditibacteriaceae bacterium]